MAIGENKAIPVTPTEKEQRDKKRRITREIKRLMISFEGTNEDTMRVIDGLIKEAAYMQVTLEIWKSELDKSGWVEMFQQSEKVAPYQKKKPMAEMYLNLNPNYQKIMKELASYMPKEPDGKIDPMDDGFDDFVAGRG